MSKRKIEVQSLKSRNMNCKEYIKVHKRMYVVSSESSHFICLHYDSSFKVCMSITELAFKDFVSYEMDFDCLLNLFAALCVKAGGVPF